MVFAVLHINYCLTPTIIRLLCNYTLCMYVYIYYSPGRTAACSVNLDDAANESVFFGGATVDPNPYSACTLCVT